MDANFKSVQSGTVIGLSGPIASGKTTIAIHLEKMFGFVHLRSSSVLRKILQSEGEPITETTLQDLGKKLIMEIGSEGMTSLVLEGYVETQIYVFDSIRHVSDLEYFYNRFGEKFHFFYVEVSEELRVQRYRTRSDRDNSDEGYKARLAHPVESEIKLLRDKAHVIENFDSNKAIKAILKILTKTHNKD